MKLRLLYFLTFVLIIGSMIYWWRVISFSFHDPADVRIADVASEYQVTFAFLEGEALQDELSQKVDSSMDAAGVHSDVLQESSPEKIARLMRHERVDVYIDSIFTGYVVAELANGKAILTHDFAESGGVVVVRKAMSDQEINLIKNALLSIDGFSDVQNSDAVFGVIEQYPDYLEQAVLN